MSKTKDEIIDKIFPTRELVPYWDEFFKEVKECMQTYADQAVKQERERIKELEEDNEHVDLGCTPDYSSGILSGYGGGNIGWWQDYIRSEVERCNEYWREIINPNQ